MDFVIKINCQTSGRDKTVRFFQYSCRTLWYLLQRFRLSSNYSIGKFQSLEYHLSTFRKLLRFGRCIENFYLASRTFQNQDQIIRLTCTLSHLSSGVFLLCDHMLWLGRAGLRDVDSKKWFNQSNRYWFYAIVLNLVKDYYELRQIVKRKASIDISSLIKHHKTLLFDTLKNIFDLFIPLTALGYLKLSPGLVGIFGMISSIAGVLLLLDY